MGQWVALFILVALSTCLLVAIEFWVVPEDAHADEGKRYEAAKISQLIIGKTQVLHSLHRQPRHTPVLLAPIAREILCDGLEVAHLVMKRKDMLVVAALVERGHALRESEDESVDDLWWWWW